MRKLPHSAPASSFEVMVRLFTRKYGWGIKSRSGKPHFGHFFGRGLIGSKNVSRQSMQSSEVEISTHRIVRTFSANGLESH
jgi:hypothetical protein